MHKSQLRRLALDHAHGEVSREDYLRERGELIDAIAVGKLAIERKAPTPLPSAEPNATVARTPVTDVAAPAQTRHSTAYIVIGAIVLAALAYFVWPMINSPQTPIVVKPPTPPAPEVIEKSATELLVRAFLDENNWNEASTDAFLNTWAKFATNEQGDALSAPWFIPLATALRQEINARRALAGLSGGEADRIEGRRLVEFARAVGIRGNFPSFDRKPDNATAPSVATETLAKAPAAENDDKRTRSADLKSPDPPISSDTQLSTDTPKLSATAIPALPASNSSPKVVTETSTLAPHSPARWFTRQPTTHYSLQLFAVRDVTEINKLAVKHPSNDVHVIATGDTFRLLQGSYSSEARAKAAHAALPAQLRADQPSVIVRSFLQLRAAGATEIVSAPYTLQLFVFGDSNNADKLMSEFKELPLRVVATRKDNKHRILLGAFSTPHAARAAGKQLPQPLLAKVGTPVVKLIANPAAAAITD